MLSRIIFPIIGEINTRLWACQTENSKLTRRYFTDVLVVIAVPVPLKLLHPSPELTHLMKFSVNVHNLGQGHWIGQTLQKVIELVC